MSFLLLHHCYHVFRAMALDSLFDGRPQEPQLATDHSVTAISFSISNASSGTLDRKSSSSNRGHLVSMNWMGVPRSIRNRKLDQMPGGDVVLENGIHTVGFQLGVLGILDQHLKLWVWDRFEHIEDTLSIVEPSVPDQSPSDTGAVLLNNSADYLASKAG